MTENPLNRERTPVSPSVVPASFVPSPEKYVAPVSQELRTLQSRLAQGYTLQRINALEIQLHKSLYKREPVWRDVPGKFRPDDPKEPQMYSQEKSDALLNEALVTAKTARTIMLDKVSEWAGNLTEVEINNALPDIWNEFVQIVQGPVAKTEETSTEDEDILAPEDMEPVAVVSRPEIPDDAPMSEVTAPEEPSLGDILGQIAGDNAKD